MAATYRSMKDVKVRLEEATASAKPEDSIGARTASAIDYIFSIRDVALLIRAVKTLNFSTRLSLDCCLKMTGAGTGKTPVGQLVSLMSRCNRSEPHKEVNIIYYPSSDILLVCYRLSPLRWTFLSTSPGCPSPERSFPPSPASSPTSSRRCWSTETPALRSSLSAALSSRSSQLHRR